MSSTERDVLLGRLGGVRRHVLEQVEGLDDEQLRRPVLPSGWSCLGLLRHLTLSDERYWFEVVVAGRPSDFFPEGRNADWVVGPDEPAAAVVDAYRAAVEAADAVLAATDLDAAPAWTDPWWEQVGMSFPDVRSVVLHVLVETATHAGHLDAVRELLDGRQHIVL
ncbi:DinB family protein [Phycicoccus avicenniae]|uniref:DinB family protein n=1 Tax=Phycicoccus avicenniae TaxID=2828860 RepID=UPI003D2C4B4D